ncbi:MAG TPA: flagellar biosynthetic protein FliR [Candidatus Sulfotelmatobacter sp.]|nr:flagellar biosynthetic protein FliR [Candidatus Sulfotelmatobacter sp.]
MLGSALEPMMLRGAAIAFRVGSAFTFAPFFGSAAIPARLKAVLVLLCTALLYPQIPIRLSLTTPWDLTQLVLSEVLLGLLMGLCLQLAFESVQLAGQLGGFQMSFSLVNVLDPQTNVDTPVLANFEQMVALLLFLQMNVHHWILRALQRSFERVPPGTVSFSIAQVHALFHAAGAMWVAGLQLAAPLMLATIVIDVTVGFVSKAAPQIPVLFLSIPIKTLLGFAVLALSLSLWPSFFEKQFAHALDWSWRLLELAK